LHNNVTRKLEKKQKVRIYKIGKLEQRSSEALKHRHRGLNSKNFLEEDTWRLKLVVVVVPVRSEGRAVRRESRDRGRLGDWANG
jgi:hypothetical protein